MYSAFRAISPQGGDIVLIANAPDGQAIHYLMGTFGRTTAGALRVQAKMPRYVDHIIIYSDYPDVTGRGYFDESDKVLFMNHWDGVLGALQEFHGAEAEVAIYPSAEIQYFA